MFLVKVSVHLYRICLGDIVHIQLHKHTLKSLISSTVVPPFRTVQCLKAVSLLCIKVGDLPKSEMTWQMEAVGLLGL